MNSLRLLQKVRAITFIHKWYYVKYQELKFEEKSKWTIAVEQYVHFLYCPHDEAMEYRKIRCNVVINSDKKDAYLPCHHINGGAHLVTRWN